MLSRQKNWLLFRLEQAMVRGPAARFAILSLLILLVATLAGLLALGIAPENIYVSMERNMKCAVGLCGHCQFGPTVVCRDGAVYRYSEIAPAKSFWLARISPLRARACTSLGLSPRISSASLSASASLRSRNRIVAIRSLALS